MALPPAEEGYDPIELYRRRREPLSLLAAKTISKKVAILRSLRTVVIACVVVTSSVALVPSGAGASRSTSIATHHVSAAESAGTYWTAKRMAAAEWMPLPRVEMEELSNVEAQSTGGDPYFVEGSAPELAPSGSTRYAASKGPLPFLSIAIDDPSLETYRTHGAIFGTAPDGNFGCSGTLVNSDNKSVVWTAAHCLYEGPAYFTNIVFVPGYEVGQAPYGQWEAASLHVPGAWVQNQDPTAGKDFGAIVLKAGQDGTLAGDVVGTRGIAFNQQPNEFFQSYGYPAVPTRLFDGEHLHSCESPGTGRIFPKLVAMGCNMKQGSSGGGWVIRGEYVASNQSIGIVGLPGLAFGPYLGSDALALYNLVRGGTTVYPQPTPTGSPEPYKEHQMSVSLKLTKHVIAKGRVTAASGHVGCTQLVPIQIARLKKSGGEFFLAGLSKTVFTKSDGTFRVKLRDRKKAFYGAIAYDGTYDLSNDCAAALSRVRKHQH